jgi:hypothetical protein
MDPVALSHPGPHTGTRDTAGAGLQDVCAADLTGVEGGAPLPLAATNVGLTVGAVLGVLEGVSAVYQAAKTVVCSL